MHQVFTPSVLNSGELCCPECAWKGKGKEAVQEYLFLTEAIELYCPSCKNYFGFIDESRQD